MHTIAITTTIYLRCILGEDSSKIVLPILQD